MQRPVVGTHNSKDRGSWFRDWATFARNLGTENPTAILMSLVLGITRCVSAGDPASGSTNPAAAISKAILDQAYSGSSSTPGQPGENTNVVRSFLGEGVIREIPAGGKSLIVRHEAIPGFMPRMTMEFTVRDPTELSEIKVGDTMTFRVLATEEESWIEAIKKIQSTNTPVAEPGLNLNALGQVAELKIGDKLPDFSFLAENGRKVRFSDFEGCALAFTFIFTRCPMPEFCPRMNHSFALARELLLRSTGGPTNWQFLSLSFDPEFDSPKVLTSYAGIYRGEEPDRWLFAVMSTNMLASLQAKLDFRVTLDNGALVHNLRTIVLDPHQRIYRQFKGNQWKPEELANSLIEAASSGSK